MSWKSIGLCYVTVLIIGFLAPNGLLGFTLTEVAPEGKRFTSVIVDWTNKEKKVVTTSTSGGGGFTFPSITYNTEMIEAAGALPKGTIVDWKQTRTLNDRSAPSTLEGVFARSNSPLNILGYEEAYSILGLNGRDSLFLPDFSADLNADGVAESRLFSAINMYDLASKFPQFVNNQPFNFGQSYTASEFTRFGFVFSLIDNIRFDFLQGYVTDTPIPSSTSIIADSTHITGIIPEPSTLLLLGSGLAGLVGKRLLKMAKRQSDK